MARTFDEHLNSVIDLCKLAGAVDPAWHSDTRAEIAVDPNAVPINLGRRPKAAPPAPRQPRVAPEIIPGSTTRETCVLNKGRLSASEIAAQLGITRNAVIGHWHRAKEART